MDKIYGNSGGIAKPFFDRAQREERQEKLVVGEKKV